MVFDEPDMELSDATRDSFFDGRLQVRQHQYGYRFSLDAILLAHQVRPCPGDRILDLGTGCGIIPMVMAYRVPGIHLCAVEIQDELARLAMYNVKTNRMTDRIRVLHGDLKTLRHDQVVGPMDIVISNPPYRKIVSGRINPDRRRAVARHEIEVTLTDIVQTARRFLRTAGRFVTIYPAERTTDLLLEMRFFGLEPKRLRAVHSKTCSRAKLIIVEGVKGAQPGVTMASPLIIYRNDGAYSEEIEAMFMP